MSLNTKIDLYDGKVTQLSGELLHLSGCTHIYGEFLIQSGGTISILDNHGSGKIFTSDSNGVGTWQTYSESVTGASNGLTKCGENIVLGGTLTGDTVINVNNRNFCINDGSDTDFLYIINSACTASYGPSNKAAGITELRGYCSCLTQSILGAIFTDNSVPTPNGISYAGDYSAGYTCLSIPHVGWVTGLTSTAIQTANNGLTKEGTNVKLGGELISTTDIIGEYTLNICGGAKLNTTCGYQISGTTIFDVSRKSLSNINIGYQAGDLMGTGTNNTAIGYQALYFNTTGEYNIGIGTKAGFLNSIGTGNTFIGRCAGFIETGSNKLYINNSAAVRPLIYGDFSMKCAVIHGALKISGVTSLLTTPFDGTCLDSVLVWNSGSKIIRKVPYMSGGTQEGSERITKRICQTSHGFVVNNVIGWSGNTYNKAIALSTYDGEILGLATKCYNADSFDLTQAGYVTGLTSLSANTTYFLSDVTPGLLTASQPTIAGHISKAVIIANSSTSGWVLPYPGYVLATSTGTTYSSLSEFTITGNSSATGFTINHAKNKQFVAVEIVKNSSPYATIYTNVERTNANCVCVTFDTAPTIGQQYKILIIN